MVLFCSSSVLANVITLSSNFLTTDQHNTATKPRFIFTLASSAPGLVSFNKYECKYGSVTVNVDDVTWCAQQASKPAALAPAAKCYMQQRRQPGRFMHYSHHLESIRVRRSMRIYVKNIQFNRDLFWNDWAFIGLRASPNRKRKDEQHE